MDDFRRNGESDSNAPETYILKLQELVANLRKDLNNARLPFIVGELAEWRINGTSETFNEMLRTVPQHIPYSYCVSSKELVPLIDENDPHFHFIHQADGFSQLIGLRQCFGILQQYIGIANQRPVGMATAPANQTAFLKLIVLAIAVESRSTFIVVCV